MKPAVDQTGLDPQQLQQALAQLHDIAEPAAPSWWPLAPGWWGLLVGLLLLLGLFFLCRYWWQKTALRRAALKHFTAVEAAATEVDDQRFLVALAELLRRASQQRYPDSAGLAGAAWAAHLNRVGETNFFTTQAGQQLLESRFSNSVSIEREPYLLAVKSWLAKVL